jgi:predicted glycosyltransferase
LEGKSANRNQIINNGEKKDNVEIFDFTKSPLDLKYTNRKYLKKE